jgi:hypothetical protein
MVHIRSTFDENFAHFDLSTGGCRARLQNKLRDSDMLSTESIDVEWNGFGIIQRA